MTRSNVYVFDKSHVSRFLVGILGSSVWDHGMKKN
jgi:hypothetical protein